MQATAKPASFEDIAPWRDAYRLEMACQIIHDSIHTRSGWTQEYLLSLGHTLVGYGSVAIAGPWSNKPTIYEFYVVPHQPRQRLFDLFAALLAASHATKIEVQSNDPLGTHMLHAFAHHVTSESILFHDQIATGLHPLGAEFRQPTAEEATDVSDHERKWRGVIEVEGQVAATGGVLFHYNPPYGDIYMEVAEPFRKRGLGAFLVQELKRVCYERGRIPAARCRVDNVASRKTLQKAGFIPCGHILTGSVPGNLTQQQ